MILSIVYYITEFITCKLLTPRTNGHLCITATPRSGQD